MQGHAANHARRHATYKANHACRHTTYNQPCIQGHDVQSWGMCDVHGHARLARNQASGLTHARAACRPCLSCCPHAIFSHFAWSLNILWILGTKWSINILFSRQVELYLKAIYKGEFQATQAIVCGWLMHLNELQRWRLSAVEGSLRWLEGFSSFLN